MCQVMSPIVKCATAAVLLCPYPYVFGFALGPSQAMQASRSTKFGHNWCKSKGVGSEGFGHVKNDTHADGVHVDDFDVAKGRSPPRSVLSRAWDVEVDLHGERNIITVHPGDSILEAVSTNI